MGRVRLRLSLEGTRPALGPLLRLQRTLHLLTHLGEQRLRRLPLPLVIPRRRLQPRSIERLLRRLGPSLSLLPRLVRLRLTLRARARARARVRLG
jgi:hypothetical protein